MPALRQTETVELFDLDGTCNDFDIKKVLDESTDASPEVRTYINAAATFVHQQIPEINEAEALAGVKAGMQAVFPQRSQHEYWATFPTADKRRERICPSVDHYLLTPRGVAVFLRQRAAQEQEGSSLARRISELLEGEKYVYPLYKFCSAAALDQASIDEDALGVLEGRLSRNAFAAIFTNSSIDKARTLATRAGFGDHLVMGGVARGKLGIIGDGKKFEVDPAWAGAGGRFGNSVDLSEDFGFPGATVDLRRHHFYNVVSGLMETTGARRVWMASDISELDLFPVANWEEFNPGVAMRVNPTSSPESIAATQRLLAARVGSSLSSISNDLE